MCSKKFCSIFLLVGISVASAEEKISPPPDLKPVLCTDISSDGSMVAAGVGRDIVIWKIPNTLKDKLPEKAQEIHLTHRLGGHPDYVTSLVFRKDGKVLAAGTLGEVWLWDVENLKPIAKLPVSDGQQVVSLDYSSKNLLVAGSGVPSESGLITFWNSGASESHLTIKEHSDVVYGLSFNPEGTRVVACDAAIKINVWDTSTGKLVNPILAQSRHVGYIYDIDWSHDGKRIATACADGDMKVFKPELAGKDLNQTEDGNQVAFFRYPKPILTVDFDPKTGFIVMGCQDGALKTYDSANKRILKEIKAHENFVQTVSWCPTGKWIVSGSWDGTVKAWNAETGKQVATLSTKQTESGQSKSF